MQGLAREPGGSDKGRLGADADERHHHHTAHLKKKVTPRQVLPFPWEGSKKKAEAPKVSAEEARKRFERLKKQLG